MVMDFCYNKSMGNGAVASKFRLTTKVQSNQSNLRTPLLPKENLFDDLKTPASIVSGEPRVLPPLSGKAKSKSESKPASNLDSDSKSKFHSKSKSSSPEVESTSSHHPSNCNRCYRLKKKCSRTYPKCSHCERTGSDCEYVDRSKKRRKTNEGSGVETSAGAGADADLNQDAPILPALNPHHHHHHHHHHHQPIATKLPGFKSMSVSSLLANDAATDESIRAREMQKNFQIPTAALASSARRARERVKDNIVDKINFKITSNSVESNKLKDEFIAIRGITDKSLPITFALNFFENFGHKYPFVNKDDFLSRLGKIDFSKDSIVNLDVYLLLSIGCVLYDMKCLTGNYESYFKTKSSENILDILDLSFAAFNPEVFELLLLLSLYGVTRFKLDLVWNLVGILNRAIVKFELHKKLDDIRVERIFWSTHNLDKELSVLVRKPSQFPKYDYFEDRAITNSVYSEENLALINHYISLAKIQDSLVDSILKNTSAELKNISGALGRWVGSLTKDVSLKYVSEPHLQDLIPFANAQSYYLQTEMDQLSTTKSFQFPSQFIFYSFTLLIAASDKSAASDKKQSTKLAIVASGFWYLQLFNVIKYSIGCLGHFISSEDEEVRARVIEFHGFLQQAVNLLKYLRGSKTFSTLEGYSKIDEHVNELITILESLSIKLLSLEDGEESAILDLLKQINKEASFGS
ncbi:uncharacterized protein LODBEIA_P26610 [Lodderomyces beijingensis]|uniref:Zn(2)-C6 fungal-type domain-containing protein n=1 Tax=Lodderomyces beijingensis TaxID=1775926 RepID=A0ABP0ZM47_9ASCO